MDSIAREVLTIILDRLRQFEKTRLEDEADLMALRAAFCLAAPENFKRYEKERESAVKSQVGDPSQNLGDVYVGLIELLRNPDQTDQEKKEKIRHLSNHTKD